MIQIPSCYRCIHCKDDIDGCDAYPNGFPEDFHGYHNTDKECANGYRFENDEKMLEHNLKP